MDITNKVKSRISKALKDKRSKGITYSDMAKELGVSASTLANYRDMETVPNNENMPKIINYLGLSEAYVYSMDDSGNKNIELKTTKNTDIMKEMDLREIIFLLKKDNARLELENENLSAQLNIHKSKENQG